MIEGPVGLVEEPLPLCAHVVIPIVLAGDEHLSSLNFRQELNPERELVGSAELGQVAAEDQKVGRRVHRLHFTRGALDLLDEPRVDGLRIEVGVGNPGKLERLVGSVSDVDRIDQRPPCECLSDRRRAG